MNNRAAVALLLCLGLLGVVAVGGAAAVSHQTPVDSVDAQTDTSLLDTAEVDDVDVDEALRDVSGEVEVIVSLTESERALGPSGLQAHAAETRQPLESFAQTRTGVTIENRFWLKNAVLVTVDTSTVSLSDLAAVEGVRAIHENAEFQATAGATAGSSVLASGDTAANNYTYGLEQINAPTAWQNHNTTGEGASVAVLDTGVAADHPDLSVAKWQEFDGDGNPVDSEPNDGDGHGTHVSGTVSGPMNPNGDVPAYGVAPGVDLYGAKVLDDSGGGSFARIIAGMQWAVDEDADIISMSLGATGFYDQMIDPVQNAVNNGTIVVSSAGNSGAGSSGSPGNVYETIAVGASNSNGGIASFSSGEEITTSTAWSEPPASWPDQYTVPSIAAPGVNTLSSVPGGGYDDTYSGTSMAAPHVSGAVALAESALDKELTAAEVEEALEATAFKPGDSPAPPGERDTRYGSGIIDTNAFIAFLDGLEDEPFLSLTASGPATVETNENLQINYTVENIGGAEGTESAINLVVNDTVADAATNVTVGPNETVTGSLTFDGVDEYEEGELIDWTVEMVDTNTTSSGSTGVGLLPGTDIVIQSLDYTDPVSPDGTLNVDYTLENLGAENGTESFVDLKVDGTDSAFDDTDSDVQVPGGETATGTLTFDGVHEFFEAGDNITFTVELWDFGGVAAGNTTVEVPDSPQLSVESAEAPETVETNETLTVNYTLANSGGAEGTESAVELVINDTVEDTDTDVAVPAQGSASGSLTFDGVDEYEEGDLIEWTVQAANATGTESGSTSVGALPGTEIVIQSIDYSDPVSPDGTLNVDYTLENLGAEDGTESFVDLKVDGTDSPFDDTDSDVAVPGGGTTTGTLTFDAVGEFFEAGDTISFTVELWDSGDVASGNTTVAVPDEPVLSLRSVDAPVTVTAGENLEINYTLENIGSVAGTESAVELLTNGTVEDSDTNVSVPAEGTTNGTLVVENVGTSTLSSIAVETGDEQVDTAESVEIDRALRSATGTVEAIVSLPASDRTLDPSGLQAHASATQQPLMAFADAQPGVTVESTFWLKNAVLVTVDTSTVSLSDLAAVEGVRAIHKNAEFQTTAGATAGSSVLASGDTAANNYTYGLEQINAPTAWQNHNTTGEGVSVAVLDTGVAADHPDLSVAKWQEFDGDGNPVDSEPNDGSGHGTHVSGTATGAQNPAGDVPAFGVAPDADLYGAKVLADDGSGSFARIIAGMQWAVDEDADIISMSLGATGFYDQMIDPVQNAHDAGTVVITSAGNSYEGSSGSPGNVYDSIAVGASNSNQGIAGFSSGEVVNTASDWGSSAPAYWPDEYTVPTIAAPGVGTLSSVPGGGYDDTFSGTSMAAPHVSGAVALALSASDANVTPQDIEQALEFTAFKPDDSPAPPGERDTRYGSGIIDANALVEYLEDPPEGEMLTYTVSTADTGDSQSGEVFVENASDDPEGEANFTVANADSNSPLPEGETLEVNVTIENVGGAAGTQNVTVEAPALGTSNTTVELEPGNSTTLTMTMELGTGPEVVGNHTMTVETESHGVEMPIEVHMPTMPGEENPPTDVDGDDKYEDVDGDGELNIFDVQMLFNTFEDGMMDEHGWAFDFDDDGDVTIFDVQGLFNEL